MPEKKFVISPGKRIFSRVEQECETKCRAGTELFRRQGQDGGRVRRRGAGLRSVRGRGEGIWGEGKRKRRRAQKAGGTKGMRERGGGGKSQGQETGLQRGKGSRGEELSPKESLSTAARNESMRPVGPRREERTRPEPKKGRLFGESAGLSRRGGEMQARCAEASGRQLSPAETLR